MQIAIRWNATRQVKWMFKLLGIVAVLFVTVILLSGCPPPNRGVPAENGGIWRAGWYTEFP